MSGVMERTLAILERLATDVAGVPLATLADELDMPRSAAHRLLTDLAAHGYVHQSRERGHYMLTTKLVSLGLNYTYETFASLERSRTASPPPDPTFTDPRRNWMDDIDENVDTMSSVKSLPVSRSVSEPTVMTLRELPGLLIVMLPYVPRLPAAMTVTTPLSHSASTACTSGSVVFDSLIGLPSDRFATRTLK